MSLKVAPSFNLEIAVYKLILLVAAIVIEDAKVKKKGIPSGS